MLIDMNTAGTILGMLGVIIPFILWVLKVMVINPTNSTTLSLSKDLSRLADSINNLNECVEDIRTIQTATKERIIVNESKTSEQGRRIEILESEMEKIRTEVASIAKDVAILIAKERR